MAERVTYSSYLRLDRLLSAQQPRSGETTHAMRTLRRVLAILKIVVAQLDVLETMTPTATSASPSRPRPGCSRC